MNPDVQPGDRYKRRWKNLLINKRYQLSFTLFMVGVSTVLMFVLGIWVMYVANDTTTVSKNLEHVRRCVEIPAIEAPHEELPPPPPPSMKLPDEEPAKPGSGDGLDRPRHPNITVTLDDMQLPDPVLVVPPIPSDFKSTVVAHWACKFEIANAIDRLERGRVRILFVLIGTGLALVLGLALYGIKMTHRVAGPLFKVQLYLAKMRDGRFDKVYNLRKRDQLLDFYDHFKRAHAGIVELERSDIVRLEAVIAAAQTAGVGDHPAIAELRALVARKEKSVE